MKILMATHQLSYNLLGGAEIQIDNTKINLEKYYGLFVKKFNIWEDAIEDFDIIHIFNPCSFPIESYLLANYSIKKGVKVVISPIYWRNHGNVFNDYLYKTYLSMIGTVSHNSFYYLKKLFHSSNFILPNTKQEKIMINNWYSLKNCNLVVINNAVSLDYISGNSNMFIDKYNIKDFILYVGGIYPRKNIYKLIKAFNKLNLDTSLVIVGRTIDNDYLKKCKKISNEKIIYLNELSHDSEMLKSVYKAAKVIALPSYFETPGLAALEGGIAGSNILITRIGGTTEYFKNFAWYIDPFNENNISSQLYEAYKTPKNDNLSKYISKNFTWEITAKNTYKIYKECMLK